MLDNLAHRFLIAVDEVVQGKFSSQVLLDRQVQHGVNWMFTQLLGDLGYGPALQVLVLFQTHFRNSCLLPNE